MVASAKPLRGKLLERIAFAQSCILRDTLQVDDVLSRYAPAVRTLDPRSARGGTTRCRRPKTHAAARIAPLAKLAAATARAAVAR